MDNLNKHNNFFNDLDFILKHCNRFRLYLAFCNDDSFIQESHNVILNEYNNTVKWLSFPSNNIFLFSFLENNIESSKVTIVCGLKDNLDIDCVLATMNVIRENFYKFNLPIILWVDESILTKFIKIAPDFYNCTGTIHLL
jgi:hypothetical protein